MSAVPLFWGVTTKSNKRTFLVALSPKKASLLPWLIILNLKRSLINIFSCRLACKNVSNT